MTTGDLTGEQIIENGKMRRAALMKAGYDLKTVVCFACLVPHMKNACDTYGRGFKLSTSLCYVDRKPDGFHTRAKSAKRWINHTQVAVHISLGLKPGW